jgi:quercetin dioxygenase-like cupin family protein
MENSMTQEQSSAVDILTALMEGPVVSRDHAREAILIHEEDLPHVTLPDNSTLQLLQVDLNQNLWIVRNHFKPGFCIDTHYHTGPVFAVTQSGEWFYKEYPDKVNKAGSYLFEPAHSLHTLTVAEDAAEEAVVWFAIFGSNINIDDDGNVTSILDAKTVLTAYRALCELEGKSCDKVIVVGE